MQLQAPPASNITAVPDSSSAPIGAIVGGVCWDRGVRCAQPACTAFDDACSLTRSTATAVATREAWLLHRAKRDAMCRAPRLAGWVCMLVKHTEQPSCAQRGEARYYHPRPCTHQASSSGHGKGSFGADTVPGCRGRRWSRHSGLAGPAGNLPGEAQAQACSQLSPSSGRALHLLALQQRQRQGTTAAPWVAGLSVGLTVSLASLLQLDPGSRCFSIRTGCPHT